MTFQALSEEDRRQWLDAMDGREPVYSPGTGPPFVRSFNSKFIFFLIQICYFNQHNKIK